MHIYSTKNPKDTTGNDFTFKRFIFFTIASDKNQNKLMI